ncbi:MAG: hypothetical protein RL120_14110 [Gammaproteobacteria bacterium]
MNTFVYFVPFVANTTKGGEYSGPGIHSLVREYSHKMHNDYLATKGTKKTVNTFVYFVPFVANTTNGGGYSGPGIHDLVREYSHKMHNDYSATKGTNVTKKP